MESPSTYWFEKARNAKPEDGRNERPSVRLDSWIASNWRA